MSYVTSVCMLLVSNDLKKKKIKKNKVYLFIYLVRLCEKRINISHKLDEHI